MVVGAAMPTALPYSGFPEMNLSPDVIAAVNVRHLTSRKSSTKKSGKSNPGAKAVRSPLRMVRCDMLRHRSGPRTGRLSTRS
jgi:hypothetical protein